MQKPEKPERAGKAKRAETSAASGEGGEFQLGGETVPPGKIRTIELPISRLSTHTEVGLPVRVLNGRKAGPVMFVCAGVHGDEVIGVEIIRRLLGKVSTNSLAGTLICVPVVNIFGFIQHQRYLPDRRDLNRCFPGSANGSLAAQLAHVFTNEIIKRSDFGIDLHSAALHRTNLPQIRIGEGQERALELANAFGPPAVITAPLRDGSMRMTATKTGVDVLLYESGEALRFDELAIRIGVRGILRVMAHLGMGGRTKQTAVPARPILSKRTSWVRAPEGGIFRAQKSCGDEVSEGETLGRLSDPFGDVDIPVNAPMNGIVIGRTNLPVVNQGDALMHIAAISSPSTAGTRLSQITDAALADPLFDEDEVI